MSNALMDKYFEHRRFLTDRGLSAQCMPEDPDPEDVYEWAARWINALELANQDFSLTICTMKYEAAQK